MGIWKGTEYKISVLCQYWTIRRAIKKNKSCHRRKVWITGCLSSQVSGVSETSPQWRQSTFIGWCIDYRCMIGYKVCKAWPLLKRLFGYWIAVPVRWAGTAWREAESGSSKTCLLLPSYFQYLGWPFLVPPDLISPTQLAFSFRWKLLLVLISSIKS